MAWSCDKMVGVSRLPIRGFRAGWLIGPWVLVMISLPIVAAFGGQALAMGVQVSVVLQAAAVLAILVEGWGWRRAFRTAIAVLALSWVAEVIGLRAGCLFGVYEYSDALGLRILGVPWLIPLAWFMMLPAAWAVAATVTGGRGSLPFAIASSLAFTAWNLFLDPQMVH